MKMTIQTPGIPLKTTSKMKTSGVHLGGIMVNVPWVRKNPREAAEKINALMEAIKPYAEAPLEHMNEYVCHRGLCVKEQCGRCSQAIAAYNALNL